MVLQIPVQRIAVAIASFAAIGTLGVAVLTSAAPPAADNAAAPDPAIPGSVDAPTSPPEAALTPAPVETTAVDTVYVAAQPSPRTIKVTRRATPAPAVAQSTAGQAAAANPVEHEGGEEEDHEGGEAEDD